MPPDLQRQRQLASVNLLVTLHQDNILDAQNRILKKRKDPGNAWMTKYGPSKTSMLMLTGHFDVVRCMFWMDAPNKDIRTLNLSEK